MAMSRYGQTKAANAAKAGLAQALGASNFLLLPILRRNGSRQLRPVLIPARVPEGGNSGHGVHAMNDTSNEADGNDGADNANHDHSERRRVLVQGAQQVRFAGLMDCMGASVLS